MLAGETMGYSEIIKNWETFAEAINEIGGEVKSFSVEEPATKEDVQFLEEKLGISLPPSMKEVLLNFSRKVEFRWFFPDKLELEGELSEIFSGDRHWSLEWLYDFNKSKDNWIKECFPNKKDPYDVVWHNKFAFHEVGNGDYLAIDMSLPGFEPVVYLSHDDGEGHGIKLAENFKEFLFVSSRLGCVGGEDWQLLPFIEKEKPYLNADCINAKKFREALHVKA
jgi:cell wall assembly regulator SMI1